MTSLLLAARRTYAAPVTHLEFGVAEYADFLSSPFLDESIAGEKAVSAIVIGDQSATLPHPGAYPIVVVAVGDRSRSEVTNADLTVKLDELDAVLATVEAAPIAATSFAVLVRLQPVDDVEAALAFESAVYSTLQAGPEFAAWRKQAPYEPSDDPGPTVITDRSASELRISLNRVHRHNAISTRLRDELSAALHLAIADDTITSVRLNGNGPSFCSGGDLGEFGTRPDPATAHITRLARSPARLIHQLRERVTVEVHGSALGGGIEMAAFASRIIAHEDSQFGLPEVGLGLIPGAGGTVSLPRRIGRQRTAWLGLSSRLIDARTALAWGLVDELA